MVSVHLVGMGLLGSLTAWRLYKVGIPFTWWDTDSAVTAWKASTGCCYPSGGEVDNQCYWQWRLWIKPQEFPTEFFEVCSYWVDSNQKSYPHGLQVDSETLIDPLRLGGKSVHINSQGFVKFVRGKFKNLKREVQPRESVKVISHGFGERLERVLWGWTRLVKLQIDEQILELGRPSFYLRQNRFQFAYCYPVPNSAYWYAGSSLISQREPKSLEILPKYESWRERFINLSGGLVRIMEEGETREGWRPKGKGLLSESEGYRASGLGVETYKGVIHCPSMASNGFRHFPAVWESLCKSLKINPRNGKPCEGVESGL